MPQLSVPVHLVLLLLSIFQTIDAVKPVWRTGVTNVRKNATSRTQRASNSLSNPNDYQYYAAQKPYYTRPEDFKIPDYRTVKSNLPNDFRPNPVNEFITNNRNFQPQFVPNNKYFQPQFINDSKPPNREKNIANMNRFFPYSNGQQQLSTPSYPPNNGFPRLNNYGNQWYNIPPNVLPYWEGAGPIPPQGAYGPTPTTKLPMRPSVNPENYHGTIPTQPSINPEIFTTLSRNDQLKKLTSLEPTLELYNPTTFVSQEFPSTSTDVIPTIFATNTNPFDTSSTSLSQTTSEILKITPLPEVVSTTPYSEILTESYVPSETLEPLNPTTALETTFTQAIASESNTTPETSTFSMNFHEYSEKPPMNNAAIVEPNNLTVEEANTHYFPRPASFQVYQPSSGTDQRVEHLSQHIDVNFIKPNRTCTWPICGIDEDKVSVYKPENGNGRQGPILLISNAAKDEAARLRYIPPAPRLIPEYLPLSTSTEYYNNKFVPGSIIYPKAEVPTEYDSDKPNVIEPIHLEVPKGPHVFMPPQNFPTPSTQTQVPPAEVTKEITTESGYSPTAKTIATSSTQIYSSSSASTLPSTTSQTTSAFPNTQPHFEFTHVSTNMTTKATTEKSTSLSYTTPSFYEDLTTTQTPATRSTSHETSITPSTSTSTSFTGQEHSTSSTFPTISTDETTKQEGSSLPTTTPSATQGSTAAALSTTGTISADVTLKQSTTTPTDFTTTIGQPVTEFPGSPMTTSENKVKNKVRGKVHVVCKEDGIEFSATTLFPFSGEIFANDRKRIPSCSHKIVDTIAPKVFLPFVECGVKNAGDQMDSRAQFHMQVVVVIQQDDGTSTIQSFMAQCMHQKIQYNKQTLPRRIEEALEELKLVATKIEQKAPLPQVEMKIVVDEHHQLGPEVSEVDIGMPLAIQWKLAPESDAYGFFVKDCIVKDDISNIEHKMIDEFGCSTDLSILAHPHYDTYHDTASSHLWAFKVPDHTKLRIRCDVVICSDIPSSSTNISSCASIPSPPFCPDLITSPTNSILYDAEGAFLKQRRQVEPEITQSVKTALCTGLDCDLQPLGFDKHCFDLHWIAASTGLSFASLIVAVIMQIAVRVKAYPQ